MSQTNATAASSRPRRVPRPRSTFDPSGLGRGLVGSGSSTLAPSKQAAAAARNIAFLEEQAAITLTTSARKRRSRTPEGAGSGILEDLMSDSVKHGQEVQRQDPSSKGEGDSEEKDD